jgi:hypothetical protein
VAKSLYAMKIPQPRILILLAVLAAVAGFVAWRMGLVEWALSMKEPVLAWCRSHPFVPYLLISIPINGLFVTGFVLTGGAIFEGSLGAAIAGLSILIAASFAVKIVRRRMASAT